MGGKLCVCVVGAMCGSAAFDSGDELDEPPQPVSAGLDNDGNGPSHHPFKWYFQILTVPISLI